MLKIQELAGASPPAPPPELCPGPAGGLTAPPRPPAVHFKTLSPRMLQSYKRAGSAPGTDIRQNDLNEILLTILDHNLVLEPVRLHVKLLVKTSVAPQFDYKNVSCTLRRKPAGKDK